MLGEHREQAAHEEQGDALRVVAPLLQQPRDAGQPGRHVAGNGGGMAGGVERERRGPDRRQPVPDVLAPQIVERDAETGAVGELLVMFPLTGKIGEQLDHPADIDDDQEGRPAMLDRQGAGILLGLFARAAHQDVPLARAGRGACLVGQQARKHRPLGRKRFRAQSLAALLGLQHEAAALVEVDPAAPVLLLAGQDDRTLEDIVVAGAGGMGGVGRGDPDDRTQLGQEQRVIGALGPAFARLPTPDERLDRRRARHKLKSSRWRSSGGFRRWEGRFQSSSVQSLPPFRLSEVEGQGTYLAKIKSPGVRFDFAQCEQLSGLVGCLRNGETTYPPYIAIASRRNAAPLSVRL